MSVYFPDWLFPLVQMSHAGGLGKETLNVAFKKVKMSRVQTVRTAAAWEYVSA